MDLKPKDVLQGEIKPKSKPSEEIRIEPPIPIEPIIKSNINIKQDKAVKADSGNTISKDAIKKEDEERKILAESKQILDESKGDRQMQFEKNKRKPVKYLKDLNSSINKQEGKKPTIFSDEKKNQTEEVVKDKLPLPLVLKEAKSSNKTKIELNRDKRDLKSTILGNDKDDKQENCKKNEKEETVTVENKNKENM